MKQVDLALLLISASQIQANQHGSPTQNLTLKVQRSFGIEALERSKRFQSSRIRGLAREGNVFVNSFSTAGVQGTRTVETRGKTKGEKGLKERGSKEGEILPEGSEDEAMDDETEGILRPSSLPTIPPIHTSNPTVGPPPRPIIEPTRSTPPPATSQTGPASTLPWPDASTTRPTRTISPSAIQTYGASQLPTLEPASAQAHLSPNWNTPFPLTPGPTQAAAPNTNSPVSAPRPTTSATVCQTNANGDFGSKLGDVTVVEYLYQMELFPGVAIQDAITQIEKQLGNFLLPVLFPEVCAPIRRLKSSTESFDEGGFYAGIAASPVDALAAGFECVGLFLEPCFVVRGWLTCWSEGKPPELVIAEVSLAITNVIDSGSIEQEVIDVDRIVSLRDPTLTAEPIFPNNPQAALERASPTTVDKAMTQAPFVRNDGSQVSSQSPTTPRSDLRPTPSVRIGNASDSAVLSEQSFRDPKTFILAIPWWIWLFILLEMLTLAGLKAAFDMYRKRD